MTRPPVAPALPPGVQVFERGWLSSNNILLCDARAAALVDTGYGSHAAQTCALVRQALRGRPLDLILNTHLHSDHCGGNQALQAEYAPLRTLIPPGQAQAVRDWHMQGLSFEATGQRCARFRIDGLLEPGSELRLGGCDWQVHAAGGHDMHAVLLFEPRSRTAITADALWQNGFGVVFPELDGEPGFAAVAATLDLIEALDPRVAIPGHGPVFVDVAGALQASRRRLEAFVRDPVRHAKYAAKVFLKFMLLETQAMPRERLLDWVLGTPYLTEIRRAHFAQEDARAWGAWLLDELIAQGAAAEREGLVLNAEPA